MLEATKATTRTYLARAKATAILGEISALELLHEKIGNETSLIDKVTLAMLLCELLHYNFEDALAIEEYREHISPHLAAMPDRIQMSVAYNLSELEMATFVPSDFYAVVDASRITNSQLWNYRAFYEVMDARDKQRRYESLPDAWQELSRTYRQGCWGPYRRASSLFAIECMELGWPDEAVYHTILSGDKELSHKLGDYLLTAASEEMLEKAVDKWLDCTAMKRLFSYGCEILDRFIDAIPEDRIEPVFERVRHFASLEDSRQAADSSSTRAWSTLKLLSERLTASQSERLVELAVHHPIWNSEIPAGNRVLLGRDTILKTLARISRKISSDAMYDLAEKSIPLVTERRQNSDYMDAINLLGNLADAGGEKVKSKIKQSLYPAGTLMNGVLLQVASHFGVELQNIEGINETAKTVVKDLQSQVTYSESAVNAEKSSRSYMVYSFTKNDGRVSVQITDAVLLLGVLSYQKDLLPHVFQDLVDAILGGIANVDNVISNKIALIKAMTSISNRFSEEQVRQISDVLVRLAEGYIVDSPGWVSSLEANNPLNPFKMNMGKPSELRGMAIYLLACIEREKPNAFGSILESIIETALSDMDVDVRKLTLAAVREKPGLSEQEYTAVILATRDLDAGVANAAFGAIALKKDLNLTSAQYRLLIHSAQLAAQSKSVLLRRAAAVTCNKLRELVSGNMAIQLAKVSDSLAKDRCDSVRRNLLKKST